MPALSTLGGFAILGESPGPFVLAGVVVIATAVALSSGFVDRCC